jgi:hypothetical protein
MGYTSLFIARALSDNVTAFGEERTALLAKTEAYLDYIDDLGPTGRQVRPRYTPHVGLEAIYRPKATALGDARTEWMFREPTLARPGHYIEDYCPHAYCVDTMGASDSSAPAVLGILERLSLSRYVSVHQGDFWALDTGTLPREAAPLDLIWIDSPVSARNAISLINGRHWEMLNPNGGLLVIHCLLTTEGGQLLVEELFKQEQHRRRNDFELLGLLEPHRVLQNNCLAIRKTRGFRPEIIDHLFTAHDDFTLENEARSLLRR